MTDKKGKAVKVTSRKKRKLIDKVHKMPSGNRPINPRTVAKLRASIEEYGVLRNAIVVRTKIFNDPGETSPKLYMADGQHLYDACYQLGRLDELSVTEVKREFKDILELVQFVSLLNSTQSPWRTKDYVHAFSSTHKLTSYTRLIEKVTEYKMSYTLTGIIFGNVSRREVSTLIKSGNFRIADEVKGDKIARVVSDAQEHFGRVNSRALYTFAHILTKEYDPKNIVNETLQNFVKDNIMALMNAITESQMREVLSKYKKNYKSKTISPEFENV
jgi:hypothetical protein